RPVGRAAAAPSRAAWRTASAAFRPVGRATASSSRAVWRAAASARTRPAAGIPRAPRISRGAATSSAWAAALADAARLSAALGPALVYADRGAFRLSPARPHEPRSGVRRGQSPYRHPGHALPGLRPAQPDLLPLDPGPGGLLPRQQFAQPDSSERRDIGWGGA